MSLAETLSREATWQPMAGPWHAGLDASWSSIGIGGALGFGGYKRLSGPLSNENACSLFFCEGPCTCADMLSSSEPKRCRSFWTLGAESPRLLAWLLLERRRAPEGLGDLVERHGSKWLLEAMIWGAQQHIHSNRMQLRDRTSAAAL